MVLTDHGLQVAKLMRAGCEPLYPHMQRGFAAPTGSGSKPFEDLAGGAQDVAGRVDNSVHVRENIVTARQESHVLAAELDQALEVLVAGVYEVAAPADFVQDQAAVNSNIEQANPCPHT